MDLRIRFGSVALLVLIGCGAPGPERVELDARDGSGLDARLVLAAKSVGERAFDDARVVLDASKNSRPGIRER